MRIMYTSGTTDRPKGVMHSYHNSHAKPADQMDEGSVPAHAGARGYLSQRFAGSEPPEALFDAYAKLLDGALFAR